jgi:DNA-binding beta-propeller fold protein YncE
VAEVATLEQETFMRTHQAFSRTALAVLIAFSGATAPSAENTKRNVNGTIWVANRGSDSIRGWNASTGADVATIAMRTGSQPGDLVSANGKLYVAEERATPPAVAIVEPGTTLIKRIFFATGARPHHVHATTSGELVAVGLYGTDRVAVIETENDTLLGEWDSDPLTTTGRVHAGVFSQDGETLYLLNDATAKIIAMEPRTGAILWSMDVAGAHEMVVAHNGKTAFVSRRPFNALALVDLENHTYDDVLSIGLPDTLRLSANEKLLTIGVRTSPAQLAVMDTETFAVQLVNLAPPNTGTTTGGHQWTTPNGQYTFASYEGVSSAGLVVIDHRAGNQVVQRLPYPLAPHGVTHAVPE